MIDDDERKRIRSVYSKKKSAASKKHELDIFLHGFPTADLFVQWWDQQFDKQHGRCAYCQTSIDLIRSLIQADFLRTRKTRGDGNRGTRLELERKDPCGSSGPDNCVLVCMCCNNDKSNVYDHEQYEQFFGPNRKAHYQWLATKLASRSDSQARVP